MPPTTRLILICALALTLLVGACDHGLEPPDVPPLGSLEVDVSYTGTWPAPDSLKDLRFVAFRFIPRDTTDFFRLNEILFSPGLPTRVPSHHISLDSVVAGIFLYSGIAQRFGPDLLDWRPLGLYTENDGIFAVSEEETTRISIEVDFRRLPPFPPSLTK